MMHIVATNIILWLGTLIKESVEEIVEVQREHETDMVSIIRNIQNWGLSKYIYIYIYYVHYLYICTFIHMMKNKEMSMKEEGMGCSFSLHNLLKSAEEEEEICKKFRRELVGDAHESLPILFPFIIEFALIGASVGLLMSQHIGR